jgi:hypothetical protein
VEDHFLPLRLAAEADGEIVVDLAEPVFAEQRPGDLGQLVGDRHQRPFRMAGDRAAVARRVVERVDLLVVPPVAGFDQPLVRPGPEQDVLAELGLARDFVSVLDRHRFSYPWTSTTIARPWPTPMQSVATP